MVLLFRRSDCRTLKDLSGRCNAFCLTVGLILFAAACGGSDPVTPTNGSPNKDSASAVIGPAGGKVVVPSGAAGVEIPASAVAQPVTVTVSLLPPSAIVGDGPLPTSLKQYPPYYEFATSPAGAALGPGVRVGVCQVSDPSNKFYPPEATHSRLRLAHRVNSAIEVLDPVDVSDFLNCSGVTAQNAAAKTRLARFASIFDVFRPTVAYAAHGGLGGKVKSFSPFAAVDPGPQNVATTFPVSSRGAFLLTDTVDDAIDPPAVIELSRLGFVAGDAIRLERLGDYKFSSTLPETGNTMHAVFSSTNELLDRLARFRVPGAIAAGVPFVSQPTLLRGQATDIPEDFLVTNGTVTIPAGALYLFVGIPDPYHSDNSDTDNNLAVRVSPPAFSSAIAVQVGQGSTTTAFYTTPRRVDGVKSK